MSTFETFIHIKAECTSITISTICTILANRAVPTSYISFVHLFIIRKLQCKNKRNPVYIFILSSTERFKIRKNLSTHSPPNLCTLLLCKMNASPFSTQYFTTSRSLSVQCFDGCMRRNTTLFFSVSWITS